MKSILIIGILVKLLSVPTLAHPGWGIDFDSKGNLYFTDIVNKTIWKYSPDGELVQFSKNKWSHQLFIDSNDNLIICNEEFDMGNGWNSVIKIFPDGEEKYLISPTNYGEHFSGSLIVPYTNNSILYEFKNKLYVKESNGNFNKFITLENFNSITNLHYEASNEFYIVDGGDIKILNEQNNIEVVANNLLERDNERGAYDGRYNHIYGVDTDESKNIYAAYYGNAKVLKISPDGEKSDIYLSPKNWFPTGVKLYNGSLFILEEGHLNDDGPTALRIVKIDEYGGVIILVSMGHIGGKSVELID